MKKKSKFILLIFVCITVFAVNSIFHSCRKDVEPVYYYAPKAKQTIDVSIVDSKSNMAIEEVNVTVDFPDGSNEIITSYDGFVSINVKNHKDGIFTIYFKKFGFVPLIKKLLIQRSGIAVNDVYLYNTTVLMTALNEKIIVEPDKEVIVELENSDVNIYFPIGSVNINIGIGITELPCLQKIAHDCHELGLSNGRFAYRTFYLMPEGYQFNQPIQIQFILPNQYLSYVFLTFIDGKWQTVDVMNNGDGTGTANISFCSEYILTTSDVWEDYYEILSDDIFFIGNCDKDLEATISQSFDSNLSEAKNDMPEPIYTSFSMSTKLPAIAGYERKISGRYTIKYLKNKSKGYTIAIPSFPVVWSTPEQQVCHTGGAGS